MHRSIVQIQHNISISRDNAYLKLLVYKLSCRYSTAVMAANHKTHNAGTFTRAELSIFLS